MNQQEIHHNQWKQNWKELWRYLYFYLQPCLPIPIGSQVRILLVVKLASWWINVHGGWQFCLINVVLACNVWFNIILTQFIATRLETAHLGRITIIWRKIAWFKMKDIQALVANERSQEGSEGQWEARTPSSQAGGEDTGNKLWLNKLQTSFPAHLSKIWNFHIKQTVFFLLFI